MTASNAEGWLRLLLSMAGGLLCTAAVAVFLPTEIMAKIHAALGMGDLPRTPLVEYLTRSVAALYAVHGGFFLMIATDVRRYWPLALYAGLGDVAFGIVVTGIDIIAGMPWFWTIAEGPPVIVVGVLVCWLTHHVRKAAVDDVAAARR